jgi:hypothetical protein
VLVEHAAQTQELAARTHEDRRALVIADEGQPEALNVVHTPAQIRWRETELIGDRTVVERFLGSLGHPHGVQQRAN